MAKTRKDKRTCQFITNYNDDTYSEALWYVNGGYETLNQAVPTGAGLARHLICSRQVLYNWAKVHPEFKEILEIMNTEQEVKLINGGLTNRYNYAITKLMLVRHGYHDRVDSDLTSGGEAITKIEIVALNDNSTDKATA